MYKIIRNLDIININGIGKTTAEKLYDAGINTIDLLAQSSPADINKKTGITLGLSTQHYSRARIALLASTGLGDSANKEKCTECSGRGTVYHDETCPKCNGTTKITFDDNDSCVSCSGEGIVTHKTMDDCSVCGGDGEVTLENYVSCGVCRGTGIETYAEEKTCPICNGYYVSRERYSVNCYTCGGDGIVMSWRREERWKTCPNCKGKGWIMPTDGWSWLLAILSFGQSTDCARCRNGVVSYYVGVPDPKSCTKCGGDGKIDKYRWVYCPDCIEGAIIETLTRQCTACGGDGQQTSTTTAQCGACHGLGKTLNVSREKCNDCQGSGIKTEHHEIGCPTCGETGILKSFDESKCLRCNGEGIVTKESSDFSGINLETFVSSPTEDLVASGTLDEASILAMKRAVGTLYYVLDEPCVSELML